MHLVMMAEPNPNPSPNPGMIDEVDKVGGEVWGRVNLAQMGEGRKTREEEEEEEEREEMLSSSTGGWFSWL